MPKRRDHPYIRTTWLPRLLTGESNCEWAIWFKAHYQGWAKLPSDFNQAVWLARQIFDRMPASQYATCTSPADIDQDRRKIV